MLDRVGALTGVSRLQESQSYVTVTFTGTPGTIIPKGTHLSATLLPYSRYITFKDTETDSTGVATVVAHFEKPGANPIVAGSIDTIENPINGITAVTNLLAGTTGRDRETDKEFRVRREKSLSLNSIALVESVHSALLNIPTVQQARVFENDGTVTDYRGIPAHTILCVVIGGTDEEVITEIMRNKSLGCGTMGDIELPWIDKSGFSHLTRFSRPTEIPIFIKVKVTPHTAATEQKVINAIIDYVHDAMVNGDDSCGGVDFAIIGQDIHSGKLYPAVLSGIGYNVTSIEVGNTAANVTISVPIGITEIGTFDSANIEVTA